MKNRALRQELRYEPASVIPLKHKHSLLDWLESQNRLIPRDEDSKAAAPANSEGEISDLMGEDDSDDIEEEDEDLDD